MTGFAERRFECKYVLSEAQARAVRARLAPHLEADPHAARRGGSYRLASLYVDSPNLRLYRETIEGRRTRFKLRIRSYTDDPDVPVFLEIKRRRDKVISKTRARVARAVIEQVWGGVAAAPVDPAQRAALDEFTSLARLIDAQPFVLVRYEREALQSPLDQRARVTFDRQLMSAPARGLQVRLGGDGWHAVAAGRVILEMKFRERCPSWMSDCVHALELDRVSYSKYANALARESSHRNVTAVL